MGLIARIKESMARRKRLPVLGLALGSGGAKGMAHLGALKAFEEEGLSFGVVAGASIGSIVGALLAKGYSVDDMIGIVESFSMKQFGVTLPVYADLSFAERFLEQYVEGDISELPIPFAAWATDAETNEGVMFSSGKTARVLTASSAIAPVFRAVEIGGKRYYDGAYTNAVPAEACRALGADFVVGVDLAAFERPAEEKGRLARVTGAAFGMFGKMASVHYAEDCRRRGYDASDVMLRPDLGDYTGFSVSVRSMNAMYELGYREAKARMQEILSGIEEAIRRVRSRKKT